MISEKRWRSDCMSEEGATKMTRKRNLVQGMTRSEGNANEETGHALALRTPPQSLSDFANSRPTSGIKLLT